MLIPTAQNHIRIDSSGMLLQAGREGKTENTETYHLLSIPRGGEFTMTLADGTRVWLNSESELHFPLQFGGEQRIVQLTGEAYFEVAKDAARPFIVKTSHYNIEVLGTRFNVADYDNDMSVHTTLVEGKVAVSGPGVRQRILQPNEQFVLDKNTGKQEIKTVDVSYIVAWKDAGFRFRDVRLEDIMAFRAFVSSSDPLGMAVPSLVSMGFRHAFRAYGPSAVQTHDTGFPSLCQIEHGASVHSSHPAGCAGYWERLLKAGVLRPRRFSTPNSARFWSRRPHPCG